MSSAVETSRVLMFLGNEQLKKTVMLSLPKHLYLWLTPYMKSKAVEMLRQAQHDGYFGNLSTRDVPTALDSYHCNISMRDASAVLSMTVFL
ncbi:hypothetical protein PK28_12470 [Hymenobacter sp. DG25B]|nr:hypothetical protein PK28_12470 [Hymenobacter sp. DG25B]